MTLTQYLPQTSPQTASQTSAQTGTVNTQKWEKVLSKLVAMAWVNKTFYQRLVGRTAEVLREAGIALEDRARVVVNQNGIGAPSLRLAASGEYELSLPARPEGMEPELIYGATEQDSSSAAPLSIRACCTLC